MSVDKTKAKYLGYRDAARALFTSDVVSFDTHTNVQIVENGAYVEAHVYVSAEQLEAFLNPPAPVETSQTLAATPVEVIG